MQKQKLGTDELEKLLVLLMDMGESCGSIYEDKRIDFRDLKALMNLSYSAKEMATDIDFSKVVPQFGDLDPAEAMHLASVVGEHLDLPEEDTEDHVKKLFLVAAKFYDAITEAIVLVKHPEARG